MSFGVYIHIPYCLQRCHYCDFATYEVDTVLPPANYLELVKKEMRLRAPAIKSKYIDSIYFGGGTPSLLEPKFIVALINELANLGFIFKPNIEITMEINPGTTFNTSIDTFITGGINRFSVGAQTFDDKQLEACGRKHSSIETHQTLGLLKKYKLNFTLDILFALPNQSLSDVSNDVDIALSYLPKHISAYCLTVPNSHKMSSHRAEDQEQVEMFNLIEEKLLQNNLNKYEISNFSQAGFESVHNMIYWTNQPYWGIGLSAHSYFPDNNLRFWNPKSMGDYQKLIENTELPIDNLNSIKLHLNDKNYEFLQIQEIMTDFCHIHLRTLKGLPKEALRNQFKNKQIQLIEARLNKLKIDGLIEDRQSSWKLSKKGLLISNLVFDQLYFSKLDLSSIDDFSSL